jgi:hypothetical protein
LLLKYSWQELIPEEAYTLGTESYLTADMANQNFLLLVTAVSSAAQQTILQCITYPVSVIHYFQRTEPFYIMEKQWNFF